MDPIAQLCIIALLSPLAAFLIQILFSWLIGPRSCWIAVAGIGLSFVCSAMAFIDYFSVDPVVPHHWQFEWVVVGKTVVNLGVYVDNLTVCMITMVTFIATLIHLFSIGYMKGEIRFERFFSYLSLFCFSMLLICISDNIFVVFAGWELVGLCSYLLIGFYYEKKSASNAAIKAFVTNRVGDVGMIIGLMIIWFNVGSFQFEAVYQAVGTELTGWLWTLAGLGIFLGCMGKSAQFPLHVWLPDAMEGPTPVSALIHAATMVAAGVYLVGRFYPLFDPTALMVIAYVGCATLLMAATIAITATDIKKVLAYSTVSQLGYMMLAMGVGAWGAGILHLLTHAFFKALLFLCSGSVIYGCHHEQEMPKMGGLWDRMRITAVCTLAGVLAISGVIFFSGYYSKDAIVAGALMFVYDHPQHLLLFVIPTIGAGITAFYMFRLYYMTFTGEPRDHSSEHAHESPALMWVPLAILAVFAIGFGPGFWQHTVYDNWLDAKHGLYVSEATQAHLDSQHIHLVHHMEESLHHRLHLTAGLVASVAAILGIVLATLMYWDRYKKLSAEEIKNQFPRIYDFINNKWYVDELYWKIFVNPCVRFSTWVWQKIDVKCIDPFLDGTARKTVKISDWDGWFDQKFVDGAVNLTGRIVYSLGRGFPAVQTGRIRQYILFLATAVVCLFVLISFAGS